MDIWKHTRLILSIDKYLLHHIDHNVMLKENKATEYIEQYWYMNVMNRTS